MTVRQIHFVGDSIFQGAAESVALRLGGKGTIPQRVTQRLSALNGLGPIASSGFIPAVTARSDWTFSGQVTTETDWSDIASTDAWDRAPVGFSTGNDKEFHYSSGSAKTATWTKTADIIAPIVEFTIYVIDYTNGGTPSYRIDGGSWTNLPSYTPANDNKIVKVRVASSVTSTVEVRCANAAGTAQGCALLGIEVWYQNQTSASGLVGHNLAIGGTELFDLVRSTSGDRMAWFDPSQIRLANSAVSHLTNVDATVACYANDVNNDDTTQWNADLTTFEARVDDIGPVGVCSMYGAGFWDATDQTAYRAQTKTTQSSLGFELLDWYDKLAALGFGTTTATQAAALDAQGWLDAIDVHPRQPLVNRLAEWTFEWMRAEFFSSYTGPPTYTSKATQPSVAAAGTVPAHVAIAGLPIAPIPV